MPDLNELARCTIVEGERQHLHVTVEGPGVGRLAGVLTMGELADPEEQIADVVALFGAMAERAFFTADRLREPTVTLQRGDEPSSRKHWRLETTNVDRDAFRVLSNLMASIFDTRGGFAPVAVRDGLVDADSLAYPLFPTDQPFPFSYEAPVNSRDERFVRIEFCDALRGDVVDRILRDLDLWASLLVYGGYRDDRANPMSGAAPEAPILEGKDVIGITIPIVLDCSEAMYCPLLNYLARVHAQVSQIALVSIE